MFSYLLETPSYQKKLNMQDEYGIIKLSFHIKIKTYNEWNCTNFDGEKYSKNVYFI